LSHTSVDSSFNGAVKKFLNSSCWAVTNRTTTLRKSLGRRRKMLGLTMALAEKELAVISMGTIQKYRQKKQKTQQPQFNKTAC
jgi:hypothetical protein